MTQEKVNEMFLELRMHKREQIQFETGYKEFENCCEFFKDILVKEIIPEIWGSTTIVRLK